MEVTNEYPGKHHYIETWDKEQDWFCPKCGLKDYIWTNRSGDYYAGSESMCTRCQSSFYLQGGPKPVTEQNSIGILMQLVAGVQFPPTTRRVS